MGVGRIIAIDGPAGSGKSSAARRLAKKVGYLYLDTGALYRAVGWKALKEGVDVYDPEALHGLCARLQLMLKPVGGSLKVYVNGKGVAGETRTPEVSRAATVVAALPVVRERLLGVQREIRKRGDLHGGVVVEGRDIGTVVFPDAPLKFFLEASPEVRVKRRYRELKRQGLPVDLSVTRSEMDQRDRKDSHREMAPLKPAEDAIRIDSTRLSLDAVVAVMLEAFEEKMGRKP